MMFKKFLPVFLLIVLATTLASAGLNPFAKKKSKKDNNPIAGIDSKQPDKVLFDRAMEALKKKPLRRGPSHAANVDQHLS
jgi:hypothetical protein